MKRTMLVASSVIAAYNELIRLPAKQRDAIIRELRKGPGVVAQSSGMGEKGVA